MTRPVQRHQNMGRDIVGLINTDLMKKESSIQLGKTNPQNDRVMSNFDTIIKA
ncbi:MAG TPA: hypothetical protein V6D26_22990 [Stenomitos sp.]